VRTLADPRLESENYRWGWDGRSERGESLAPGVYFIQASTPGATTSRTRHPSQVNPASSRTAGTVQRIDGRAYPRSSPVNWSSCRYSIEGTLSGGRLSIHSQLSPMTTTLPRPVDR
jgi:hypothetical protein